MTERRPWWYSGDDAEASGVPSEDADATASDGTDDAGPSDNDDEASPSGRDWMALLAGAQRVVDWATERVIAPHSDHGDPHEHPDCVVCRTLLVVGDLGARVADATPDLMDDPSHAPPQPNVGDGRPAADASAIAWIPIREDVDHP